MVGLEMKGNDMKTAGTLCMELNCTRSWLEFACKNLNIQRSGQGKRQEFNKEDEFCLAEARLLLILNFTWSEIMSKSYNQKDKKQRFENLNNLFKKFI
jgi:hypothetical protein